MIGKEVYETEIRTTGFKKVQEDIINTMKTLGKYQDELKELKHQREALIAAEKKGTQEYRDVTQKITAVKANIKLQTDELKKQEKQLSLTQMSYKQLSRRATELKKKLQGISEAVDPAGFAKARAELKLYESQMAKMRKGMKQVDKSSGNSSILSKIKQMAGVTAIIAAVSSGLKKIFGDMINVRKEFEKYEAVLTNTLGSETLMRNSMAMLKEFAAKTPYALTELVGGFVKLVNQGFKPTEAEMVKLGDLASSQGKSFDQLVEAIIDAQTGEFERLKEFGIRASKQGDKVKFTFKGVEQQVDFTANSIRNYILSLGDAEGVSGGMAKVSETLGGKISNIGDAWDQWMNTLGSSSGGILSWIADKIIDLVEALDLASMSMDQIKMKVRDDAAKQNLENALKEIDVMTQSGIKQGMVQQEAAKRAVRLYTESMTATINGYKTALETATGAEAENLQSKIDLMEDELELVNDHFKQQEQRNKNTKPITKDSKKQWSVTSDESYLKAKAELRERQMKGDIATEEEYSRQLLALEIKTLEERIAANKEKDADLAKLKSELAEKEYQQRKTEKSRLQKLIDATLEGAPEADRENASYEKRLKDLELFGKRREEMTKEEQRAFDTQERLHLAKLSAIYVDELSKEISNQQNAIQRKATMLKQSHNDELAKATTFEQKKQLLGKWFSAEELRRIKTDKQADEALKKQYAADEQAALKEDLELQLALWQGIVDEVGHTGLLENGVAATEEDKAKLLAIIDELQKKLAELGVTPMPTLGGEKDRKSNVDILGMSVEDWERFHSNVEAGKFGLDEIVAVANAIASAFSSVNELVSAMEQREFKNYEKTQKKKKAVLDRQLKSGTISQERYNEAVQRIDDETEAKREEMERKQAKRQKMLSVFQSLVNTAVAVSAMLGAQPAGPWNIPLAITVGAMGLVQTAAILATPLPGAEEGGLIGVEREQDGKRFNAEFAPRRRGYVHRPTVIRTDSGKQVITGEAGTEYVVPNHLLQVPQIASMVGLIESARLSGTFRPVNLPAAQAASGVIPGRAGGGYVGGTIAANAGSSASDTAISPGNDLWNEVTTALRENREVMGKLSRQLEKPIATYISYLGKDGIATIQKKLEQQQRRAGIGGK